MINYLKGQGTTVKHELMDNKSLLISKDRWKSKPYPSLRFEFKFCRCMEEDPLKKLKTQVFVAKSGFKMVSKPLKVDFWQLIPKFQGALIHRK